MPYTSAAGPRPPPVPPPSHGFHPPARPSLPRPPLQHPSFVSSQRARAAPRPYHPSHPSHKVSKDAQWRDNVMKNRDVLATSDNTQQKSEWVSTPPELESANEKGSSEKISPPLTTYPLDSDLVITEPANGSVPIGPDTPIIDTRTSVTQAFESLDSNQPAQDPTNPKQLEPAPMGESLAQQEHVLNSRLAESLSLVAEQYLNIDILDQTHDTSKFVGYLLDTIHMLEWQLRYSQAEDDQSGSESGCENESENSNQPSPPRYQILHRIFCTESSHQHDICIYEDPPTFRKSAFDGEAGIQSKIGIPNLETYLSRHTNTCFLVFKEHNCALEQRKHRRWMRRIGNITISSERGERMRIVSSQLRKALEQVAEFQIFNDADDDAEDDKEWDAPYLFLFHHRKKLATLAEDPAFKAIVTPLLKYIEENFGEEYEEANHLFSQHLVTAFHISKLFRPNQMVVSRQKEDSLEAYVLKTDAVLERDMIALEGWSWEYNGTVLQRLGWKGKINTVPEEPTLISDLSIHPADFAQSEDLEKLGQRGKKFWDMKGQTYTCYTGWDKSHSHYYVMEIYPFISICQTNKHTYQTASRFMVDMATYQVMHQSSRGRPMSL